MGERSTAQLIAYALAAILVVAGAVRYLGDDGDETPPVAIGGAGAGALEGASPSSGEAAGTDSGAQLQVHVAGAVHREGLFRLPAGTRVEAAVQRAGGVKGNADLTGVNLAAELQDGQQVIVPKRGATAAAGTASSGTASTSSAATAAGGQPGPPISLASATPEQLDAGVDGIGPTLAARIVEYRDQNGGFRSIDELREVEGIGEARFAALEEAVSP